MKVSELIEELKKRPQDAECNVFDNNTTIYIQPPPPKVITTTTVVIERK
jgi:hypothetical protein